MTCGVFLYFIVLSVADIKNAQHHKEQSDENASCMEDDNEDLPQSYSSTRAGTILEGLPSTVFYIDFRGCICLKSVISVLPIKPRMDLQGLWA